MSREASPLLPHEPFDEWAALAAVGALDDQEKRRFDAHLAADCTRCRVRLRQFSAVAATLPRALPDVPVPPGLRGRVMARAVQASEPSIVPSPARRRRPRPRVRLWAGGLVAAGLVSAFLWSVYDTRSTVQQQQTSIERLQKELAQQQALTSLVSHTDTHATGLKGTGGAAERADGWIVWSPSRKQGFLVIHHLPPLSPGRQYQLWVIAGQQPKSAGVFDVDSVGHAALVVNGETTRPDFYAVTIEGAGGAPVPSGPVVMKSAGQAG